MKGLPLVGYPPPSFLRLHCFICLKRFCESIYLSKGEVYKKMLCGLGTKMYTVCLKQFDKTSSEFNNLSISASKSSCPKAVIIENYGCILITVWTYIWSTMCPFYSPPTITICFNQCFNLNLLMQSPCKSFPHARNHHFPRITGKLIFLLTTNLSKLLVFLEGQ